MEHRRPLDARERTLARRNYIIFCITAFLLVIAVFGGAVWVLD